MRQEESHTVRYLSSKYTLRSGEVKYSLFSFQCFVHCSKMYLHYVATLSNIWSLHMSDNITFVQKITIRSPIFLDSGQLDAYHIIAVDILQHLSSPVKGFSSYFKVQSKFSVFCVWDNFLSLNVNDIFHA